VSLFAAELLDPVVAGSWLHAATRIDGHRLPGSVPDPGLITRVDKLADFYIRTAHPTTSRIVSSFWICAPAMRSALNIAVLIIAEQRTKIEADSG
jgi:hypothetical protein